jgi:hypothetical protein
MKSIHFLKHSRSGLVKKALFMLLLFFTTVASNELFAQKGNNQLAIGAELGPVLTDRYHGYKFQVGLPVKVYYGVGNHGQLMLRTGVHHLWVPPADLFEPTKSVTANLVPVALGYRRNFRRWYAEGSAGTVWERSRSERDSSWGAISTSSQFQLHYGIEAGLRLEKFDFGVSLHNNTINHHHGFMHTGMVGLKAMYKIGF